MKLLNIKTNSYTVEFTQNEINSLFSLARHMSNKSDIGKDFEQIYDLFYNFASCIDSGTIILPSGEKKKLYGAFEIEGFHTPIKKDCVFYYPKKNYRGQPTFDIRHLEKRELTGAYIEGDYLKGIDGMLKKFKMELVVNLEWKS